MQIEITEPTEYIDRGFQTASWWEKYELQPGTYEVVPWSNLPYYFHFKVRAVIKESYFASSFAGASVQPYDRFQKAGQETQVWIGFPPRYYHDDEEEMQKWAERNPTFKLRR